MKLRILSPLIALLLAACGSHAGPYIIDPAPVWAPTPVATLLPDTAAGTAVSGTAVAASVSPTATPMPKRRHRGTETATPTATVTPTATQTVPPVLGFFLIPLQDKRPAKEIWAGRSIYEKVIMEPAGATLLAAVWRERPYGDMAFLWHRQFAYALGTNAFSLQAAAQPITDNAAALAEAQAAGARYLIGGTINRFNEVKRGADDFIGTNFSGTNYFVNLELQLVVQDVVNNGRTVIDKKVEYQRMFYDPVRLGSADRDTFPRYFASALPELAVKAAGDDALRELAGLPSYTPTPTATQTTETHAPRKGDTPTPWITPTPEPGPYWVNPKTGNRVDPSWNFDPADGTPRDKFILRQPDVKPTPSRPTEQR